ncbi:hypothetical protein TNCV_70561 [Trichonephila clavipes]|nr:hypothetical protein TNCV_70561 [Trichonephila clavipes]
MPSQGYKWDINKFLIQYVEFIPVLCDALGRGFCYEHGRSYHGISRMYDMGSPVTGAPTCVITVQITGLPYVREGSEGILIQGPFRSTYANGYEPKFL